MNSSNELRKIAKELVAYPEILTKLPQRDKDNISRQYSISDNSKQNEIDKSQATKKPYSDGLLIYVADNKIIAYGIGTGFTTLTREFRDSNRKQVIESSDKIYYITEDKSVRPKVLERQQQHEDQRRDDEGITQLEERFKQFVKIKLPKLEEKLYEKLNKLEVTFANGLKTVKEKALNGKLYSFDNLAKEMKINDVFKEVLIIGDAINTSKNTYIRRKNDFDYAVKKINDALKI